MSPLNPSNYPGDWEETCEWDGKLSVHFGYPSYGWVLLSLLSTAYNEHLVIYLSDAFDPFWDLIDWLNQIADGNLPATFTIDEEGQCKELIVKNYSGRFDKYSDIEFRINGDRWNEAKGTTENVCYFLSRLNRSQFLNEFTLRLDRWLREDYDPNGWQIGLREDEPQNPYADLRNLGIGDLLRKVKKAEQSGPPDSEELG